MPAHLYDTSAAAKHYHAETGTAKVDALLAVPGAVQYVTRLSVVEFHSVFAKKVRTGALPAAAFDTLTGR